MTEWMLFRDKWKGGCGNAICSTARNVCLARGSVPCDVLFVGEAPGESEDVIGRPFVGPAGKLLDRIVADALGEFLTADDRRLSCAFANLVGCIPRNELEKAAEPDAAEIRQCSGRLNEFVGIARPRMIVAVGALARKWLESCVTVGEGVKVVSIDHPAFIIRSNVTAQGLLIQKAVVTMSNAAEDL